MPPKKTGNAAAESVDGNRAGVVTALCHLIMSCDDFKADNVKLAPSASQTKLSFPTPYERPRKINSIVNPYGFELKGGKIIQVQDGAAGPSGDTNAAEDIKDDRTKKAPKPPKPNGKARQGPAKKRKLDSFHDEDGSDHIKEENDQES